MSHGRFDKPPETMKISSNGECVEACGPLLWNGDEPHDHAAQSLTINSIEIKQGRARAATNPGGAVRTGEGGLDGARCAV
jgi:hypothetical protein